MRRDSKRKRERKQKRKQKKLSRQIHQQKRRKNNAHAKHKSNLQTKQPVVEAPIQKKEVQNSNIDLVTAKALEQDDLEIKRYEKLLGIKDSSMDDFDDEFAGLDSIFDRIFDIVPGSTLTEESVRNEIEDVTEQEKEFLDSSSEEEPEEKLEEIVEIQDETQGSENDFAESKEDVEAFERRKRREAIFGGGVV